MKDIFNIRCRRGQIGVFAVMAVAVILLLGVGYVGWAVTNSATATKTGTKIVETTNNCETAPYITLSAVNSTTKSETVSPSYNHRVKSVGSENYVYRGSLTSGSSGTTFSLGDKVQILATATDYIDVILDEVTISKCASNDVNLEISPEAAGTFTVFNNLGVSMTDSALGGATNQTSSASSVSQEVRLQSAAKRELGNVLLVIEYSNKSEISDIKLSPVSTWITIDSGLSVPRIHNDENTTTTSYSEAFRLKGLRGDGDVNVFTRQFVPQSGQTMGSSPASIYMTAYTEQAYVDVNGTFKTGVEDSDGTAKHAGSYDFDNIMVG